MYIPYLRGKQFELIALRDTAALIGSSNKISPLIEPVREFNSTLETTIRKMMERNVYFSVVINPQVGEINNFEALTTSLNTVIGQYAHFSYALIIDGNYSPTRGFQLLNSVVPHGKTVDLIHKVTCEDGELAQINANYNVRINLIHHRIPDRRYRRRIQGNVSMLDDPFNAQVKNADYAITVDEAFSSEYNYYLEEGFTAFSDYVTIGDQFQDGGFLPYAVAFHLTYQSGSEVRIHHFVSDSNDDNSDVPGKFLEALEKFHAFNATNPFRTAAAEELERYYNAGHFPGLGVLKKLSVSNHIELMNRLLTT